MPGDLDACEEPARERSDQKGIGRACTHLHSYSLAHRTFRDTKRAENQISEYVQLVRNHLQFDHDEFTPRSYRNDVYGIEIGRFCECKEIAS